MHRVQECPIVRTLNQTTLLFTFEDSGGGAIATVKRAKKFQARLAKNMLSNTLVIYKCRKKKMMKKHTTKYKKYKRRIKNGN